MWIMTRAWLLDHEPTEYNRALIHWSPQAAQFWLDQLLAIQRAGLSRIRLAYFDADDVDEVWFMRNFQFDPEALGWDELGFDDECFQLPLDFSLQTMISDQPGEEEASMLVAEQQHVTRMCFNISKTNPDHVQISYEALVQGRTHTTSEIGSGLLDIAAAGRMDGC